MSRHPVDTIVWRKVEELDANAFNPNVVFTPELRLLERSILATGWVQPILIVRIPPPIPAHREFTEEEKARVYALMQTVRLEPTARLLLPDDRAGYTVSAMPPFAIVDGYHRWRLAQDSLEIYTRDRGRVPTAELNVEPWEAKVICVRMNRAKGTHVALKMHALVRELIDVDGLDPQQVAAEIGATREEVDLLYAENLYKARNLANAPYSVAWVPEER